MNISFLIKFAQKIDDSKLKKERVREKGSRLEGNRSLHDGPDVDGHSKSL